MRSRLRWVFAAAAPVAAIAIVYFAVWLITDQTLPCMFHFVTGLHCPGCGTGRMILSIFRLDFYQAFRYNPVVFIMLPIFAGIFTRHLISYLRGKEATVPKLEKAIMILLLVVLVIFGIARNFPVFSYLAPTSVS
jgi:hypothetical protein